MYPYTAHDSNVCRLIDLHYKAGLCAHWANARCALKGLPNESRIISASDDTEVLSFGGTL